MTSLDFLYIALGGGFVLLVIFSCVLLLHLTLVLRDVNKASANMLEVTERIREVVMEPLKTLSEMTASLGFVHQIIEKVRAKYEEAKDGQECEDCDTHHCSCQDEADMKNEKDPVKEKTEKKGFFSVRKLGK